MSNAETQKRWIAVLERTWRPQLLACPFCGKQPEIEPWHGGPGPELLAEVAHKGDADLFAASRDLYEALDDMLPADWRDGTMDHMPGVAKARAALARATVSAPAQQANEHGEQKQS